LEDPKAGQCWRTQQAAASEQQKTTQAEPSSSNKAGILRDVVVCISAARAAAFARRADWCFAVLRALHSHTKDLTAAAPKDTVVSQPFSSESSRYALARELKQVAQSLKDPLGECMEIIDAVPKKQRQSMDHESVVYLLANLDSMYYVLLDHYLTPGTTWHLLLKVLPVLAGPLFLVLYVLAASNWL
jgi:hypothetical protein